MQRQERVAALPVWAEKRRERKEGQVEVRGGGEGEGEHKRREKLWSTSSKRTAKTHCEFAR